MVFQSIYPLTSLSRKKIHIIRRCIPCQAINWTWSDNRKFPNFAENSDKLGAIFNFLRPVDMLRNGCQQPNHVHSSFYRHRKVVFRPRRLKRRHFDRKVRVRKNQYKRLKGLSIVSRIFVISFKNGGLAAKTDRRANLPPILRKERMWHIYTIIIIVIYINNNNYRQTDLRRIILLKSVCLSVGVRKLQVAILARSSREMSLTVRIVWLHPVTSSRFSSA